MIDPKRLEHIRSLTLSVLQAESRHKRKTVTELLLVLKREMTEQLKTESEMSDPAQTPEHRVAMEVCGLTSSIAALIRMSYEPQSKDLLALDYETILDAHQQLGRVLGRLPIINRQAAE